MKHVMIFCGIAVLCGLFITGCGETNPYDTVKVSGVVTVNGTPMEGVTVVFRPVAADGMIATGITDKDGKFVLTTGQAPTGSGAVPGEYHPTFSKMDVTDAIKAMTEEQRENLQNTEYVYFVPKKYADPTSSGVAPVTIAKGSTGPFSFDLSK